MQIFDTIKKTEYCTTVALGFFDGVHKGHQAVLELCKKVKKENEKLVVFTFKNCPFNSLNTRQKPLLNTNEQKIKIFKSLGVDTVYCVDFCSIKNLSAEDFVTNILKNKLNAKTVVTGFNYHFGKNGSADTTVLTGLCNDLGIATYKCEPVIYLDEPISSTRIRNCISDGDIDHANNMLGYAYSIQTPVIHGNHIGTKLDTPTINQNLEDNMVIPKFGVYASSVTIENKTYIGATNIGIHPTVGECSPICETHLLNYNGGDLYKKLATTELLHFIRSEKKFDTINKLKEQIKDDKTEILKYFV